MSWMAVAIGGSAALSAGAGIYGSQQAAKATEKGSKSALGLQNQQYQNALTMLEPQRALGYGALSDIASLYGYGLPAYTPLNAIQGGYASGPITVKGNGSVSGGGGINNALNPLNALPGGSLSALGVFGHKDPLTKQIDKVFGGEDKPYGATINPATGTVDVQGGRAKKDALLTDYLRTGVWEGGKGGKTANIRGVIDRLRTNGYEYNPEAATATNHAMPTAGPTGQPGNMSRFFASPDYEFRRSEGIRGIEQGAAARGGALGGNALRATADYSSNLASGEFGNYMNRLFNIAGMGQTATGAAVGSGANYAANAGNLYQQQGDARASGIMGAYNSGANALNSGLNNWMLYKGGYFNAPTSGDRMSGLSELDIYATRAPSGSGPYAGGYAGLPQYPNLGWRYNPRGG